MKRLLSALNLLPEIISCTALSITIMAVILNVFMRYVFNNSLAEAEEIATASFCWVVFLGAAACYKRGLHVGIDILVSKSDSRFSRFLILLTGFILIVINFYLIYLTGYFSISAWVKPLSVLRIPYTFVDISATVGFIYMAFYALKLFVENLKQFIIRKAVAEES